MKLCLSKEKQLVDNRTKKTPTFGKKPSKGNFGKVPSKGQFGKKKYPWNRKPKTTLSPKIRKNDIIDNEYSEWLATQPCVITGKRASRGIGAENMHCHHIYGRNRGRNDYMQVPLIGNVHSWGNNSYHSMAESDFKKLYDIEADDIKEYFKELAEYYLEKWIKMGNKLKVSKSEELENL